MIKKKQQQKQTAHAFLPYVTDRMMKFLHLCRARQELLVVLKIAWTRVYLQISS